MLNQLIDINNPKVLKVRDLKQHPKNPRKQNKEAMEFLEKSVEKLGSFRPLIINTKNEVLAGNQLLSILKKRKIEEIACLLPLKELTEEEEKAIIIADNQNSFYENSNKWDVDLVFNEFDLVLEEFKLDPVNFDLSLKEEVEEEEIKVEEKDDEVLEPAEKYTFVKRGDVWLLGKHRLVCGDATSIDDVDKLMDGKKADMVFTDPPYNTGMKAGNGSTRLSHMFNDCFTDEEWQELMSGFCASIFYALQENSVAYICLDWRRNYELIPHIKNYFDLSNIIVWDKIVHGLGSDYKYTYELINVCKKGKPTLTTNHGKQDYQDIWRIQRKIGKDNDHATKKPIEVIIRAISHATQKTDSVLDLFAGSGSTLIACEKTNRICYTMELDEHYCGVVINRYKDFIGSDDEIFLLQDGKKIPYKEIINK